MGRPKRQYPLGCFRHRVPASPDPNKTYPIVLEYTWNRKVIRKTTNILAKVSDWNQNGNQGRGELRASYGSGYSRLNKILLERVKHTDTMLAEYCQQHPRQLTADVVTSCLNDEPVTRKDEGKDFIEFVTERLKSEYSRNKIGNSRYKNGLSGMSLFKEFLQSCKLGTHNSNSIYISDISVELLDKYIAWRRDVKQNADTTINHALTPILKACNYACELGILEPAINAQIQDMRIVVKTSLSEDESEFDGKSLSDAQMQALLEYYHTCQLERRKDFIEMFLFAFHACGLRVVDVMTLQWSHVNFEKRELRKIMVKTNKRHVIPLNDPAIAILQKWKEKRPNTRYVFDLVKDNLDLNDADALYSARNNATRCINQSLAVVGEQIALPFSLSMHAARHSFAVHALNKGLSMSVVSRLLGHGSTDITEKVYAHFLPETLSSELNKLKDEFSSFAI
jgi:integrase